MISRSCSHQFNFVIILNGKPLKCLKHFKYLELWISNDLSWFTPRDQAHAWLHPSLVFFFVCFLFCFSHPIVMPLYYSNPILHGLMHVLPILDCASVVWCLHQKKDQLLLNSVQHFALKIASHSWNSSSETLHQGRYGR